MTAHANAPRSRLPLPALLGEAVAGLLQRPGRSLLTVVGTVLGVGALVAVLGLTATAAGQISERFTARAATEVVVEQADDAANRYTAGGEYLAFPDDADQRIQALNGVTHAGVWWPVNFDHGGTVSALPPGAGDHDTGDRTSVYAASPDALAAMHPTYTTGRGYDSFHNDRGEQVALLGAAAARTLGITRLDGYPAIFIDGHPFTVIGIIDDVKRNPDVLLGVIVPQRTAETLWGLPKTPAKMLIETDLGAAQLIGSQAALALRPDDPDVFRVIVPPDPTTLKDNVTGDLNTLFLLLAGVSLLIGTFGIANTTLVAVLERIPEIGLRRSLGARPRHIAGQFLTESAILGTIGGITGTTLGILTILTVAITNDWSAIMPLWLLATAPLLGTLTGLLAGLYPAWQTTRIEPADALRR